MCQRPWPGTHWDKSHTPCYIDHVTRKAINKSHCMSICLSPYVYSSVCKNNFESKHFLSFLKSAYPGHGAFPHHGTKVKFRFKSIENSIIDALLSPAKCCGKSGTF